MANFTDGVYDVSKMGTPSPLVYSLSASNRAIVIQSTGTFNGADVVGVLYNSAEFNSPLSSTQTVTISSPGDTSTVVRLLSGNRLGVNLAVVTKDRFSTSFTVLSTSTTIIARVSAANYSNIGPNERRLWNLNG